MQTKTRFSLLLLLCVSSAFFACSESPPEGEEAELVAKVELPEQVPPLKDYGGIGGNFALTDQHGERFELSQLAGRPIMLFFGYTYCPDICPVTLSKMARVYELLDIDTQEMQTVFVSVDPERDTPEKLSEYLSYFAMQAVGLTGSREEIDAVVKKYGAHYDLNKEPGKSDYFADHSTYTYLLDREGKVRFLFRHSDTPEYMAAVTRQLFADKP